MCGVRGLRKSPMVFDGLRWSDAALPAAPDLPALRKPTISPLSEEGWVAVETIIEDKVVREIIPDLRNNGAEGIIEYPLNKVVH